MPLNHPRALKHKTKQQQQKKSLNFSFFIVVSAFFLPKPIPPMEKMSAVGNDSKKLLEGGK